MKTIAQQLNIKTFPFTIEVDGNEVYFEDSNGIWIKREFQDGKCVYYEDSCGDWYKCEYQDDKEIYFENSDGYWAKHEYQDGKLVYHEDSHGCIRDGRPKSKAQAKVEQARKLLEEAERELKEQS